MAYTRNPRILFLTPEISHVPKDFCMVSDSVSISAKAGGLADVAASIVGHLFANGTDIHVAVPDYRSLFREKLSTSAKIKRSKFSEDRLHLAADRSFFFNTDIYSPHDTEKIKMSLAYQREVVNHIVPLVKPDLVHCNDWMTGLIPALCRQMGVLCLFSLHNIHNQFATLATIEDRGIDAAYFWHHLYYKRFAFDYENTRGSVPVDFLGSGVFAAHYINTVSPHFLKEILSGKFEFISDGLRQNIVDKYNADCACGILNAPDPKFNPQSDPYLKHPYSTRNHLGAKKKNKAHLQRHVGLSVNPDAALFFWPSRLDPVQKGCHLLIDVFDRLYSYFDQEKLQVVFVSGGPFEGALQDYIRRRNLEDAIVLTPYNERDEHLAYGGSDFILMPSAYEPCGLPQMIAPIYGVLPVAHDTGGIHDTVTELDMGADRGNGFLFQDYSADGFLFAISRAMAFFGLPNRNKSHHIKRIMQESAAAFNFEKTTDAYIQLYEKMLERPVVVA